MNNSELEQSAGDFLADIAQKDQEIKKRINDLKDKELDIKEHHTNIKYKQMQIQKEMQRRARNADFNFDIKEYVDQTVERNTQYLDSAREESMTFINDSFNNVVQFTPNSVTLVGGRTGKGKTTTTANIAYRCLLQGKRVLVLSNEEVRANVFNRVTSLFLNKSYTDHKNLSTEDRDVLNDYIRKLSKRMMVIDDDHTQSTGGMSVLETMCGYLDAATDGNMFDVIIVDYVQKINMSSEIPTAGTWEVQERFHYHVENVSKKKKCPAIALMAQMKPDTKEGLAYEDRFEGRKTITKPATCVLEARPNYDRESTEFIVHKTRWSEKNGTVVEVGFLKGKYVEYTEDFAKKIARKKEDEAISKQMALVKPKKDL